VQPEKKPTGRRTTLYSAAQLDAVIDAMAAQLMAVLPAHEPVTVVGILRRGAPLADRLCVALEQNFGIKNLPRLDLSIKRYADDLTLLHPDTKFTEAPDHAKLHLTEHTLVIVDDVLYHGYSMLRALQYLVQKQPAEIYTAVLVDRGVTKLPIHADICGLRLDVAPGDVIECNVPPYEEEFKIELRQMSPC
jgi:pyrimidine operon attenuation protein / uracil phosphoribosyltransferase